MQEFQSLYIPKAIAPIIAAPAAPDSFLFDVLIVTFKTDEKISLKKVISFNVKYKDLSSIEIENYLKQEKPFNCVGSIKSEGLGITLLDEINSNDPTAIIGLPLITLTDMLKKVGINING